MTLIPAVVLWRRRINRNPKLSLQIYAQLKAQDEFGFGVTVEELAAHILFVNMEGVR